MCNLEIKFPAKLTKDLHYPVFHPLGNILTRERLFAANGSRKDCSPATRFTPRPWGKEFVVEGIDDPTLGCPTYQKSETGANDEAEGENP